MEHLHMGHSPVGLALSGYRLTGGAVQHQSRRLKDISTIFQDAQAARDQDPETMVYTVQSWLPVAEGTPGGLFFGITNIYPGKVNREYFMTKGHFHETGDRAEYYWCVEGEGMLLLMDRMRNTWAERMFPGSLHYIPGETAHRVANTGSDILIFGACWPADAGHDYEEIAINGFSARLMETGGAPALVPA